MPDLSPQQFVQQHADFHRWTKEEEGRLREESAGTPGRRSFTPENGRRVSQLRGARTWLEDTYSEATHEAIRTKQPFDNTWVSGSLHEMLDERHHPLVNEYLRNQGGTGTLGA